MSLKANTERNTGPKLELIKGTLLAHVDTPLVTRQQ